MKSHVRWVVYQLFPDIFLGKTNEAKSSEQCMPLQSAGPSLVKKISNSSNDRKNCQTQSHHCFINRTMKPRHLFLIYWKIVIFHGQTEDRHRSCVDLSVIPLGSVLGQPGTIFYLFFQKHFLNKLSSGTRMLSASLIHPLRVVICPVRAKSFIPLRRMLQQPIGGSADQGGFVFSTHLHRQKPSCRHGKSWIVLTGSVCKATCFFVWQSISVQSCSV